MQVPSKKKISYPVQAALRGYLRSFAREVNLPIEYNALRRFTECTSLLDKNGRDTLWQTVIYSAEEMRELHHGLRHTYGLLKASAESSFIEHLRVDRIDFCEFGNSQPFRIRIVNAYNDNQDYFYVKRADASRVYGLELEHLLSPNRLSFLTHGDTLVEEHVAGIPGDIYIRDWLGRRRELKPIRVAKELVKFNERCFVRLLGDMRSYNFVFVVTPDFEEAQLRIRAMDFDQQSHDGRKNFYLPQFFKDNLQLVQFCTRHLRPETASQYRREEHTLMLQRAALASERLGRLLHGMAEDPISPPDKVHRLRAALAEHYQRGEYLRCESMGALIRENLESIRRTIGRPPVLELLPE